METVWIWMGGMLVAAVPSIISGVVMHRLKRHEAKMEARDAEKAEYEYLCMENLNAIAGVAKELYVCRMLGRTANGELEDAFRYMQDTKHQLEEYLRKIAAKR